LHDHLRMATRLDQEQQRILQTLLDVGQSIKDQRARRVYERAAVQTGLVESGLRNLNYGDADSLGWRQERASLYKNPTNVRASAQRFRDEFLQHYDPGEKSYEVAWQVQRPREDLRGRYHDEAKEAAAILARYGGGGGGAAPAAQPASPGLAASVTPGQSAPALGDAGSVSGLVQRLMSGGMQRPRPISSGLPAPSFATRPVLAGQTPMGGGGPAPRTDIGALIDASRTTGAAAAVAQAPAVSVTGSVSAAPSAPQGSTPSSGLIPLGGSKNAGKGAFTVSGPNPDRLQAPLTSFAGKVAEIYGGKLTGLDGSTHSKLTVNGNVSDHYAGNATDIFTIDGKPATGARLIRAGRAALIAAGMDREKALKAPGGLYNVNGHQIIFGVNGVQYGGDHTDHLHISAKPRKR
jgi:hypothetical protein